MIIDVSYWSRVVKKFLYILLILIGIFLAYKLSIFYMPFLIAFIISLVIEPLIKLIMKKTNFSRRLSSIIIFTLVFTIILGGVTWGIIALFSESSNLLQSLNEYVDKAYQLFQSTMTNLEFEKIYLPDEIIGVLQNSMSGFLNTLSEWVRCILTGIINMLTSIPSIAICFGITILALYFICVDKIYILDQIEHHVPKLWIKKMETHIKELIDTLGGYLRAEVSLILVSFFISLIGLYILQLMGFNIKYPLLIALFIGFVDALPILGSSTVMIPWAIICGLDGDIKLGLAIIILLVIMSLVRQFIEPKLVSKNIGIHPIFTLIAMYSGFKFIGVIGLLIGPIVLIIFKNIFSNLIEKGVFKTIFEKK